ncbi:MAG: glycerol acyltransferase, partial [Alcaligenaceae bacterium]
VPLYAFVQLRTASARQSRIISANNILNAVAMVIAAGMSAGLLAYGMSATGLILVCAGLNALVAIYIYRTVPEFLWRFLSWFVVHAIYRLRTSGTQHIPEEGPALITPNHVSYVDALVLSALCPRPIRFVMDASIFRVPVLSWLFRQVNAIPIASVKKEPETLERAFVAIDAALRNGELVCVFPEGALTRDGQLAEFKPGVRRILDAYPVPVVPVGLNGLWETAFARNGKSMRARLASLRPGRRLDVNVGAPLPSGISIEELRSKVDGLVGMVPNVGQERSSEKRS